MNPFFRHLADCLRSRALRFGFLLTALEWYDYALFGYFAPVIGQQFFPSADPAAALLSGFAVFATGFIMRPLGAMLFGHKGDREGRTRALWASLVLMALPTTALGLLPRYASWGLGASVSLVLIRMAQGLAVGGNYGGSFILTVEQAPEGHKGLAGSLAMFGTLGGLFAGSAMATLLNALLTPGDMAAFGWRLPFLAGGLAVWAGHRLRRTIPPETRPGTSRPLHSPLKTVLARHKGTVARMMGVILLDGVGVYILFVFLGTWASGFLGIPAAWAMVSNTLAMGVLVLVIPVAGWWADRIHPHTLLKGVSVSFILLPLPLFWLVVQAPSFATLMLLQGFFAVAVGVAYGALPLTVVSAFPKTVRYTACGLAFNVSVALFGGTSPFVVTSLIRETGVLLVPAFVLMVVGGVSLAALTRARTQAV